MLLVSVVVEVNGLDRDVRVKDVFDKQDSATNVVSNVEVIRVALVLKILKRFLKRNHVPLLRNALQRHLLCLVEAQRSSSFR